MESNAKNSPDRRRSLGQFSGGSALLEAISKGKLHLARFILDAVDNNVVNAKDLHGKTPLIRAVYIKEAKCRNKAVELLLSKGADVNIRDDLGRTALSYAIEHGANDIVKILVKNNVDPDIADNEGNTPLMHAALVANDSAVEILIKCFRRLGLDVDKENNTGMTPLLMAARHGHLECAALLAQEGKASVTRKDRQRGMTAEEWAREQGCTTVEVLPFSPVPKKLSKFYCNGRLRSQGHSIDDSTILGGPLADTMRPRSRTLPRQASLPVNSILPEMPEEAAAAEELFGGYNGFEDIEDCEETSHVTSGTVDSESSMQSTSKIKVELASNV